MNGLMTLNARQLSVAGFSFLFAYILSFQFEGQVLYSLLDLCGTDALATYWLRLLHIIQDF